MGPGHQAPREMKVGWGLGLGSEVLPAETCPLSQGRALDIGPRLGAGYPDCPGPPPPGLGLDPRASLLDVFTAHQTADLPKSTLDSGGLARHLVRKGTRGLNYASIITSSWVVLCRQHVNSSHHSTGCLIQKTRRNTPQMSRTSRTSWMKRVCCWPRNRVHPLTDSTEELPEDQPEGLSTSMLEGEALPNSIAREQASEHVPQEDMVVELPQDWAEDKLLKTVDVSAPLLTGARLRLHCFIFLLVEHRYSNLTIYVTTEACKYLAGKVERINLLLTQSGFKRKFQ
ncbi:uncharacterized protein [Bos indicus]|uniref:Uncharacterized protein n=1 Tax=Bos indicus TaxID=9915 RepID=A0ABM4QNQ8_BOSIN